MGDPTKARDLEPLEERIRAHIRAAMKFNRLGLTAMAKRLCEDKTALSHMLGKERRAPSAWVIARFMLAFKVAPSKLFAEDPPAEFYKLGIPDVRESEYAPREQQTQGPPPEASGEAAPTPPKRRHA